MAIKLDTSSTGQDLKAEDAMKIKKGFLIGYGVIGAIIVVTIIICIVSVVDKSNKLKRINELYATEESNYNAYLAAHPSDQAADPSSETPSETVVTREVNMISAKVTGDRICELQNLYYSSGALNTEDMTELQNLTGNTGASMWFGATVNAVRNPIVWEFLTPYDSTEMESYPVLFGCYTADHNYLLVTLTGRYYAASNTIQFNDSVDNLLQYTDFGYMLAVNGSIFSDNQPSPDTQSITGMTGDLTGQTSTPTDPTATGTQPVVAADEGDDVTNTEPAETESTTTCEPTESTQQGVNDATFGG